MKQPGRPSQVERGDDFFISSPRARVAATKEDEVLYGTKTTFRSEHQAFRTSSIRTCRNGNM